VGRIDGGRVDDRGILRQVREGGLAQVEHAEDVGGEGVLQLLGGDRGDALVDALEGGVVDHDVEPGELLDGAPHELLALLLLADVPRDGDRLVFGLPHDAQRLLGVLALVVVGDEQVGTLACFS